MHGTIKTRGRRTRCRVQHACRIGARESTILGRRRRNHESSNLPVSAVLFETSPSLQATLLLVRWTSRYISSVDHDMHGANQSTKLLCGRLGVDELWTMEIERWHPVFHGWHDPLCGFVHKSSRSYRVCRGVGGANGWGIFCGHPSSHVARWGIRGIFIFIFHFQGVLFSFLCLVFLGFIVKLLFYFFHRKHSVWKSIVVLVES